MYGQTFDIRKMLLACLESSKSKRITILLPLSLTILSALKFSRERDKRELNLLLFEALLVMIFFLNAAFYSGFEMISRYGFPVNFIPVLSILPFLTTEEGYSWTLNQSVKTFVLIIVLLNCFFGAYVNLQRSNSYRKHTREFMWKIESVSKKLKFDLSRPVVFESFSPIDQEALASVDIYLRVAGARNPRYAKLNYSSENISTATERELARSAEGLIGRGRQFLPFSDLRDRDPFLITFSSKHEDKCVLANFNLFH